MDTQSYRIDTWAVMDRENYTPYQIETIKGRLKNIDTDEHLEDALNAITLNDRKKPLLALIFGILGGVFGLDRIYLGDYRLAIAKFLTCCILIGYIWVIVDWFLCYEKARDKNYELADKILKVYHV